MSEHQKVQIGQIITDSPSRDAVHVAVMPMIATRVMQPGEHLTNGIVDPFLKSPVQPGQRYWLMIYPGTITELRHSWSHPSFPTEPTPVEQKKHRSEADVWADLLAVEEE